MNELALFGGRKLIKKPFKRYNSIGKEELKAAENVIKSGNLSNFLGSWGKEFYGGGKVREFEQNCRELFDVKHAISVNSWTSGLMASLGAIGIEPGDEVIVSPWTMCASATAILNWNAIPVFADIEKETFCLDPISVEKNITKQTKAILSIDIFGHPANNKEINKLAKKYNLLTVSDSAQAPGSFVEGKRAGTLSNIGGYSLNYHKHIHTGEGGIIVTNDTNYAERCMLIRNHAEAVVKEKGEKNLVNMIGYNFRLGEIEAAIGIEQLKKLDFFVFKRQEIARQLNEGLKNLNGLRVPITKDGYSHSYYIYPLILDQKELGIKRKTIVSALKAEGLEVISGYENIHLLPIYQNKIAYGSSGFPWTSDLCKNNVSYKKGICPIAEELHDESFIGIEICLFELTENNIKEMINVFQKVWENIKNIKEKNVYK